MPRDYDFSISPLAPEPHWQGLATNQVTRDMLSADQIEVYDAVMHWRSDVNRRQYLKVGGYAGTGKTTLTAAIAFALEQMGEQIAFCAFTGKAVNVLARKLVAAGVCGQCSTLHALMYRPKISSSGTIAGWEKHPFLPFSLIVVDEASMVGTELWTDLLSYGLPILAVGDHGQLPPIGDSVVNLMTNPDLRLERIHRQAEGNPILALAQWVRDGNSHLHYEPTDSRVSFIPSFAAVADQIAADPNNMVSLCYTNKTRNAINRMVRQRKARQAIPEVGDTVICLRNNKPIFNGMRGVISSINDKTDKWNNVHATVNFMDDNIQLKSTMFLPQFGNPKTIDKLESIDDGRGNHPHSWNDLGMLFDYGYGLTCHKAQGSQFRDVVIVWENLFRDADTRNRWMYTAVTRAAERLMIVRTA